MGDKQLIISISREFGTYGHHIAAMVAEDLGINLYDRALLDEIAEENGIDAKHLEKYDERPKIPIISRKVRGHSNSMEDALFHMQSEFLKKKADSGESFVVVGRCAESVLKGREGLITIFILGDELTKLQDVKKKFNLSDKEALKKMRRHDLKRKAYHNRHSAVKWGDSRGYDLCINDSKLGIEKTVELIERYIEERTRG
ncbi:MAG: cytidylate kinase-like family protein [Lachnospiraceae bacterium]|nr:cytidylate kinase-like family protein [Lachnospiraceae bacterium]